MNWILENAEQILFAASMIVSAASALAALTPTPKDDGIARWLRKVVDFLALNIGNAKK
jgi:hypothetical protein